MVGGPALSHPDPVAEPASLPCVILLACSGTKPAEPRVHSSSYSPSTDLVMTPPLQDVYTTTPEHARGAHTNLPAREFQFKLIFMASSSRMNTSGYRVFSKPASNSCSAVKLVLCRRCFRRARLARHLLPPGAARTRPAGRAAAASVPLGGLQGSGGQITVAVGCGNVYSCPQTNSVPQAGPFIMTYIYGPPLIIYVPL